MGMRPIDVLRAATNNAADLLRTQDRGRLAPGKVADVIAERGNPASGIEALEHPAFLMLGGKRLDTSALMS